MKQTIVLLHGWNLYGSKYKSLQKLLEEKGYKVIVPDLPGFGEEPLAKKVMMLDDYVEYVKELLERNKLRKAIFIGHSFGGRIAAKFAYMYPFFVTKLIITGSPLIKKPLSLKKKFAFATAKLGNTVLKFLPIFAKNTVRILLYFWIKESDYYKSDALRETFKAIIAEDLSILLSKIKAPTLVIWGEKDTVVPLSVGKEIAKEIPNSEIMAVKNATHKLPYEDPFTFSKAVLSFL